MRTRVRETYMWWGPRGSGRDGELGGADAVV